MSSETTAEQPPDTITYPVVLPTAIQPFLDKLRAEHASYTNRQISDADLLSIHFVERALQDAGFVFLDMDIQKAGEEASA